MSASTRIRQINLSKFISLTGIEDNIMGDCTQLDTIIVPNKRIYEQFVGKKIDRKILDGSPKITTKNITIGRTDSMDGGKRKRKTIRRNKNKKVRRTFKKLRTRKQIRGLNRKQTRHIKK
jgi:hypothetical protein